MLPVVRQSGLAGHAEYVTRSRLFTENPVAIDMMVDVLTDRWVFRVSLVRGRQLNILYCREVGVLLLYKGKGPWFYRRTHVREWDG